MSVHVVTGITAAEAFDLASAIRPPASVSGSEGEGWTFTYTPDLSAGEASTLSDLVATFHTRDVVLSLAEYQSIKGALADARTQRLRTDAQWTALTAAQRDTQLIAWCRDLTDILRVLLRDG